MEYAFKEKAEKLGMLLAIDKQRSEGMIRLPLKSVINFPLTSIRQDQTPSDLAVQYESILSDMCNYMFVITD